VDLEKEEIGAQQMGFLTPIAGYALRDNMYCDNMHRATCVPDTLEGVLEAVESPCGKDRG
jgi:hypothetical protein